MRTPYLPPSLQRFSPLHMVFSTWVDHMAFGYDLVAAQRPRLLVELGTQGGLSFFTFCQSMKENGVDGLCYGVDTFEGDAHTKGYDSETYKAVANHARAHYHGFAYLMQMYFSEALRHFTDETIDLLHIDGLHTYEAVQEDFTTWYPKVRPGGIILFHDIRARLQDFGAWKFWDELEANHPETFAFNHGFGLGVLRKPGGDRSADSDLVRMIFDKAPGAPEALRAFYTHASNHMSYRRQAERAARKAAEAAKSAG